MGTLDASALVSRHRKYFLTGITRTAEWRESQLTALGQMMKDHAGDFYAALWVDLHRNRVDADWTDVKYITSEVDYALRHVRRWQNVAPNRCTVIIVLRAAVLVSRM